MRRRRARSFSLLDAAVLALFAVAGVGLAAYHYRQRAAILHGYKDRPDHPELRPEWLWAVEWPARRIAAGVGDVLLLLTLGVGTAPLRRPGLLRERGWPPPGVAAGTAGSVVVLYRLVSFANGLWTRPSSGLLAYRHNFWTVNLSLIAEVTAGAVIGAWALLLVARRWRPKSGDPDDVLGRCVGYGFVAILTYAALVPVLWP